MKVRTHFGAGIAMAGALLILAQTLPAKADDATELQTKIRTALRSAKSFVETFTMKGPAALIGGTSTFTIVAPNRYRQYVVAPVSGTDDTIIIGHEIYGNERKGKGWTVQTWDDRLVTGFEDDVFAVKVISVGPDQKVGAKTVGSFVMANPHSAKESDTLQCTYEKTTFRPLLCTSDLSTVKYTNYDDPALKIETPKNARRTDR